ncbi:MAG TPA: phosphotransferase [Gemmatales bacterium]|nr:phosphotransferase [Gemmatales bacterium]
MLRPARSPARPFSAGSTAWLAGPPPTTRPWLSGWPCTLTPTKAPWPARPGSCPAPRATAQVRLSPWRNRPVPLQPCLTDVWSDHVLFVDDKLTGLVDFGGLRWDHVAVDLARLIGSLVDGDTQAWSLALAAYARHRRLEPATGDLARLLDRTGQLAAVATWLRTLVLEPRPLADPGRAWARLAQCTLRLTQDGV